MNNFRIHRPPHIYKGRAVYMVTAATLHRIKLFNTDEKKENLKKLLFGCIDDFKFHLFALVVLSNHYHLLLKIRKGNDLTSFIKKLHGKSAIELNKRDVIEGRRAWYQYWDTCIRSENDYWRRFNYIHQNPVKHGYTKDMEDYVYSSYHQYQKMKGKEWLDDCFAQYPIVDFSFKVDENFRNDAKQVSHYNN
jgi:putative transposase